MLKYAKLLGLLALAVLLITAGCSSPPPEPPLQVPENPPPQVRDQGAGAARIQDLDFSIAWNEARMAGSPLPVLIALRDGRFGEAVTMGGSIRTALEDRYDRLSGLPVSDAFVPAKQKYLESLDHDIDGLASLIAVGEDLLAGKIDEANESLDRFRVEAGQSDLAVREGDEISARLI